MKKKFNFTLRFLILASVLMGGSETAMAAMEWEREWLSPEGVKYTVYMTDYGDNAIADSAIVTGNQFENFISVDIPSPLIFEYTYQKRDDSGNYYNVTRNLSCPVTGIGYDAFYFWLTSVNIPNTVTYIAAGAFRENKYLTSVNIPNSVIYIGGGFSHGAFQNCTSLTSIDIPNSVTYIGEYAFAYAGITSIDIPNSITTIERYVFFDCDGLTNVNISNSAITIGDAAFSNCTGLTGITIPNSVTTIGEYAFYSCSSLTEATIGKSVTSIGYHAFLGCDNLKTLYWNAQNCQEGSIIYDLYSLKHLIIGSEVQSIADYIFSYDLYSTAYIDTIACLAVVPPTISDACFSTSMYENSVLCVPEASLETYRNAPGWRKFFKCIAIETIPGGGWGDEILRGDVNDDGRVNINDVTSLIDYLLSGYITPFDAENADVDGDGFININDVTTLIDMLLQGN